MKKLVIITLASDPSGFRFEEAAKQQQIPYRAYHYHELALEATPIPAMEIDKETVLLARRPYHSNNLLEEHLSLLRLVLESYSPGRLMDQGLYKRDYVALSDKLMKQRVLEALRLPVPGLVNPTALTSFRPLMAKKRLAGRSHANYLLQNQEAYEKFVGNQDISKFVFQHYTPLETDYRVLVLGGKILGAVRRKIRFNEDGRITIGKVGSPENLPSEILDQCIHVSEYLGADLLGLDVGLTTEGKYIFIEYNWSPQFLGFERETGLDVAGRVIEYLMNE